MRLTRVCRYQRSCALSCEFLGMESRKFLGVMSSGFLDACGTQFCKELGIARQTFTNIKNRVAQNLLPPVSEYRRQCVGCGLLS